MNTTQPIYAKYEFENMEDFYSYIVASKINGNQSQVKQLLNEMQPKEIQGFINFDVSGSDAEYCKDITVQILAEKASAPTPQEPVIKTIDITAKQWFDKVNGNSYFSAQVTVNFGLPDANTIYLPFQYGYGEHYQDRAFKALQSNGIIPKQENNKSGWRYYEENKIITRNNKIEKCLKRDVIAFGSKS